MPNAIKYNTSAETLALKKGNFWIGTGDVGKGPTNVTGYYNGITPPSGGYTIYLNKETSGPSIYTVSTESQLVSLTNTIGSQSFTTSGQCLNWFATQTDKMVFNIDYPAIVTDGLVLNVDAGFTPSYPTTGTTWYDVSSGGNNGTLTNGPTYNSDNGGSIVFDGINDYVDIGYKLNLLNNDITQEAWVNANSFINGWHGIISNMPSWGTGFSLQIGNIQNIAAMISGAYLRTSWTPSLNVWYHIVATHRSSDNLNVLYVNGVQENTVTREISYVENAVTKVGLFYTYNGLPFSGNIDVVRSYNRALISSEVLQNYNATKGRFGL